MEDESVSDQMLAITVADAKQFIKEKRFIKVIYDEIFPDLSFTVKVGKMEFMNFAKVFVPKMADFEIIELFNFMKSKDVETSSKDD
jgi:hypothetical protein